MLVESDERKCAFLAVAARQCGIKVKIRNARLEHLDPIFPDTITARAMAPLERLLAWTAQQHHPGLECLFLKGERAEEEMACLADHPHINVETSASLSSPEGVILKLTGFDVGTIRRSSPPAAKRILIENTRYSIKTAVVFLQKMLC